MKSRPYFNAPVLGLIAALTVFVSPRCPAQDENDKKAAPNASTTSGRDPIGAQAGDRPTATARYLSWKLGKTLSLAMVVQLRGAASEDYQEEFEQADILAAALAIQLPERPPLTDLGDVWDARSYLVDEEKSVATLLETAHSVECAALFRLASEIMFSGILYSSDLSDPELRDRQRQLNAVMADRLKLFTVRSGFVQRNAAISAVAPMTTRIEKSQPNLAEVAVKTLGELETLLKKEVVNAADTSSPLVERPTSPPASAANISKTNALDREAESIVRKFLQPGANLKLLTQQLKPSEAACQQLLDAELARRASRAYDKLYQDESTLVGPAEGQTDVLLRKITTDQIMDRDPLAQTFPGGYAELTQHLRRGLTLYEFSFVRPGAKSGMRFDGLAKVGDRWYLFAKVWRVLDERPFGYSIVSSEAAPMPATDDLLEVGQEDALAQLPRLQAAVEAQPDDVASRARYAMALHRIGNLPETWNQLRTAFHLKNNHTGIQKGISVVVSDLESQGLFTVGIPAESIVGVLGPPDQEFTTERFDRWVYTFYGFDFADGRLHQVVDLRNDGGHGADPTELLDVELDGRGWRCGLRKISSAEALAYYYLPGENAGQSTQRVEIRCLSGGLNLKTTSEIAELLVGQQKSDHPQLRWQMVEEDSDTAIFSLESPEASPDTMGSLTRIFKGPRQVHLLTYRASRREIRQRRETWLQILRSAKLKPTDAIVVPQADLVQLQKIAEDLMVHGEQIRLLRPSWRDTRALLKTQSDAASVYEATAEFYFSIPEKGLMFPSGTDAVKIHRIKRPEDGAHVTGSASESTPAPADQYREEVVFYRVDFLQSEAGTQRSMTGFTWFQNRWILVPRPWEALEREDEAELAEVYLRMLVNRQVEDAYEFCAPVVRDRMSLETFRDFVEAQPLERVAAVHWLESSRERKNQQWTFMKRGRLTYQSGAHAEIDVHFMAVDEDVRPYRIVVQSQLGVDSRYALVPSLEASEKIIRETVLELIDGLQRRDVSPFYERSAPEFQRQVTLETFSNSLESHMADSIDWDFASDSEVHLSRPAELQDSLVNFQGSLRNRPRSLAVPFHLQTTAKFDQWQVVGIKIGKPQPFNPQTPPGIPSRETALELGLESMLAFLNALEEDDFGRFQKTMSPKSREQLTQDQIRAAFQPTRQHFLGTGAFADHERLQLNLSRDPYIPVDVLNFECELVSPNGPTATCYFEYKFESGRWRLDGIHFGFQETP